MDLITSLVWEKPTPPSNSDQLELWQVCYNGKFPCSSGYMEPLILNPPALLRDPYSSTNLQQEDFSFLYLSNETTYELQTLQIEQTLEHQCVKKLSDLLVWYKYTKWDFLWIKILFQVFKMHEKIWKFFPILYLECIVVLQNLKFICSVVWEKQKRQMCLHGSWCINGWQR